MAFQFASSVPHDSMNKDLWVKRMIESGIRNFEYSCGPFPPVRELKRNIEFLLPHIEAGEIAFPSIHMPAWYSYEAPAQENDFERDICFRRFVNFIETAAPLGMKHLTIHPGAGPEGQTRESSIAALRNTLERLAVTAAEHGMSLNLELCPRRSIGKFPEEMEKVMKDLPDTVGLCFDVNHAGEFWAEIPEWIARLGKYIRTFHISDCDEFDECHWMPGVGVLDWEKIMKEIRRLGSDFLLIYEIDHGGMRPPVSQQREMDPRFFFKAVKANMEWLDTVGK